MSSIILPELRYAESHEWARAEDGGIVTVGITDHAQHLLGDLVFVEIPEVGRVVTAAESCAVVESVKAASDVYSPLDGVVVEVNEALADSPELINQDPYGEGWIFRLKTNASLDELLDAAAYQAIALADEEDEDAEGSLSNPKLVD
ncbi:MAG TPA: glycine cleavage system protein GcvH [Candidatus Competibacteraceae bacterium]|nr:glycine cleavage system protein GcvH [Candidatus Competibacteraceae bacterium]HQA25276.1 glycine cleavage system protein GcvH [Candidatus Competibacteraceae bacterium]HQD56266.1 glycine cleavage system protein GcvH [Candidatus Competibacteraceae bacterium]